MDIVEVTGGERTFTVELTETEAEAIRSIFWTGVPSGLTYTSARTGKTVRIEDITEPLAEAGVDVSSMFEETLESKYQTGWGLNGDEIQVHRDWWTKGDE